MKKRDKRKCFTKKVKNINKTHNF